MFNPGGSIKDRVAVELIDAAERDGHLRPGGTIVEPTSGNTGTGLAIAARLKGYRVIAVMPDKMSREKIDLLRAYGAEVVVAPTDVAPDSPQSYYRVADRLTAEIPGAFQPNQYANPANPQAHYDPPGRALAAARRPAHAPRGRGRTGGTVTGTARFLRERLPDLVVVGADPRDRSTRAGTRTSAPTWWRAWARTSGRETFDPSVVDRWVIVSDRDAFLTTRRLARMEGILAGGSGGLALHAALWSPPRSRTRGADRGDPPRRRALVSVEDLLRRLDASVRLPGAGSDLTVGDVLGASARPARSRRWSPSSRTSGSATRWRCCTSTASRSCRWSARTTPPTIVGAIGERGLLRLAAEDPALLDAEIVEVMEPPFAAVSSEDPVREAVALLVGEQQALLVTHEGRADRWSPAPTCWKRWPRERPAAGRATRSPPAPCTPG